MKNIFCGLIFILLDLKITIGNSVIGLMPDFIGYIFIYKGLSQMATESLHFFRVKPFAIIMAIWSVMTYATDLLGANATYAGVEIGILNEAIILYTEYEIIKGIQEMESRYNKNLNGNKLMPLWIVLLVSVIASYALLIIPPIALLAILTLLVVKIVFLVSFYTAKRLYEAT